MRGFSIAVLGLAGAALSVAIAQAQTDVGEFKAVGAVELSATNLGALHSDSTFAGTFLPLFGKEASVPFEIYNGADGDRVFKFQGRTQLLRWWIEDGKFCHTGYSTRAIPCDWSFYRHGNEYRMFHPDGQLHAVFTVEEGDPRRLRQ